MSPFPPLTQIEHGNRKSSDMPGDLQNVYEEYFPNRDIHHTVDDRATSNIYKTGDGKYYHVHGKFTSLRDKGLSSYNPHQLASIQISPKRL